MRIGNIDRSGQGVGRTARVATAGPIAASTLQCQHGLRSPFYVHAQVEHHTNYETK